MIGSHLLITGMHIVRCSVFLGAIKIKENVNVNGRNEREQTLCQRNRSNGLKSYGADVEQEME